MRQKSCCTFIFIFLSISIFWNFTISSAILAKTLIKTSNGLIEVENLNIGDKVISFDPDIDSFIEVKITKISKKTNDTIVIVETDQGIIYVSGEQLFFDPKIEKWIEAKDLTADNILIDCDFYEIQCFNIEYLNFSVTTYEITIEDPHVFFVFDHQILAHNFFPFAAPVVFTFGSGAAASAASSGATAAVAGGLGALCAYLFSGKNKSYHQRVQEVYQVAQNKHGAKNPQAVNVLLGNKKVNGSCNQQGNSFNNSNQGFMNHSDIIKHNGKVYIKPKYMSVSKCIKSFQKSTFSHVNWKKYLNKKRIRKNKKAQKYRNKQKKRNEQKKKNKSNTSNNPKNPDDDDKNKKRKFNRKNKTEVMNHPRIKDNYKFYKNIGDKEVYKLRPGGDPLGKNIEFIHFDYTHQEIEVYNSGGRHLGAYETESFQYYKSPKANRSLWP